MGTQDGTIAGAYYIFPDPDSPPSDGLPFSNIGPALAQDSNSGLVEIVLLAEGFTSSQSSLFLDKCIAFTNWLQKVPWFDVLGPTIRVCCVNVSSTQSGMDDFRDGANITRATYFDCAMGDWWQSDPNMISYNGGLASDVSNQYFPSWRTAIILVNSTQGRANARSPVAVVPVRTQDDDDGIAVDTSGEGNEKWMNTILHELGHSLFGLADEYNVWLGCGVDTDRDEVGWGLEPFEPNVTRESNLSNVKWNSYIKPGSPVALWGQCEDCPDYDNPFANDDDFPDDSISLFEGAQYFHCGLFRPAYQCRMRSSRHPHFCQVCLSTIFQELRSLLPSSATITAEPKTLPALQACVGQDDSLLRHFRIANLGRNTATVRIEADHSEIQTTPVGLITLVPGQFLDCSAKLSLQTAVIATTPANINIINNADDSIMFNVQVDMAVCNPRARMRLRGGVVWNSSASRLELDFGRIVSGHTSFQEVRIINRRTCCSEPLQATVTITNLPSVALSIPAGQINPVNLFAAPRTGEQPSASVWVSFTADASLSAGSFNETITVTDASGNSETIEVLAEIVPQLPIDVMLAVDRSGSMSQQTISNGPTRIDAVIDAIDQFVHFVRDNDEIGMLRFNQNASSSQDLLVDLGVAGAVGGNGTRQDILNSLDPTDSSLLLPGGGTSLGLGGLLAVGRLNNGSTQRRATIMLTDGEGNLPPSALAAVTAAINADPVQRFYIIAFETEQMSEELAQVNRMDPRVDDDGNVTGPAAQILITGTLAGEREFILHKFYTQILADETGQAFVVDPVYDLASGQSTVIEIGFSEIDYAADIVVCAHPSDKYLTLVLISPMGQQYNFDIDDGPGGTGNVQRVQGTSATWKGFRCSFPIKEKQDHVGYWKLVINNQGSDSAMRATLLVTAQSDLKLQGWVYQGAHTPGVPMDITLNPTLFDQAVSLLEPVQVAVTKPDETQDIVTLERQDDGKYVARYRNTDGVGNYHFNALVYAKSAQGMTVTRERHMTGFIAKKKIQKGKFPKRPDLKPHKNWKLVQIKDFINFTRES